MMWWWGPGDHMGAAGWVAMAIMILFWIAVVIAVVYLIRYIVRRAPGAWHHPPGYGPPPRGPGGYPGPGPSSDALRILEERYARGEIDREEFMQRRDTLLGRAQPGQYDQPPPPPPPGP